MKRSVFAILIAAAAAMTGCSSMSSTYVGEANSGDTFEGMPVVVQRPKYLKVTFKRVTYRVYADSTVLKGTDSTAKVEQIGADQVVNEITTEVVSVGEVFTMDLKRPAAGTSDYTIEFEPNAQYPKKLGAKIEDKTITAIGDTLGSMLKQVAEAFKLASSGEGAAPKTQVVRVSEEITKVELRSLDNPATVYQVFP